MHIHSLATAVPPQRFTQEECWEIISTSRAADRLKPRSMEVLRKVLLGDNGIDSRHFAITDFARLFEFDAEALHHAFAAEAPGLAQTALQKALDKARLKPAEIDALLVCTCTGYLCPGLSSYIAEQSGMRPNVWLHDNVGQGCGASIPLLRQAEAIATASPGARIACVAVEICSAAFYLDNDPGVLISASLFADGAAAVILGGSSPANAQSARLADFRTLHLPEHRESLRFENRQGKLRNRLEKTVPETAAEAVAKLYASQNGTAGSIDQVVAHAGGRDVLSAIERRLPGFRLEESASILRRYGNMSSPSVLFALEERLNRRPAQNETLWLASFGAGFSCHSCQVEVPGN